MLAEALTKTQCKNGTSVHTPMQKALCSTPRRKTTPGTRACGIAGIYRRVGSSPFKQVGKTTQQPDSSLNSREWKGSQRGVQTPWGLRPLESMWGPHCFAHNMKTLSTFHFSFSQVHNRVKTKWHALSQHLARRSRWQCNGPLVKQAWCSTVHSSCDAETVEVSVNE